MNKNVTENVTNVAEETSVTESKLFVVRSVARDKFNKPILTKSGEPLFNYILPIEIMCKKTRVDFTTADKGGFEVLDFVFSNSDKAELIISEDEMEINGKKQKIKNYKLCNFTDDGIPLICSVKPQRKSDTDLLNMYLTILLAKNAQLQT